MAKSKEDRYSSAKELLIDLRAIRNGEPPLQARKKFDYNALEKLEEGLAIESQPTEKLYKETTVMNYRIAVLILGALCTGLLIISLYLAIK